MVLYIFDAEKQFLKQTEERLLSVISPSFTNQSSSIVMSKDLKPRIYWLLLSVIIVELCSMAWSFSHPQLSCTNTTSTQMTTYTFQRMQNISLNCCSVGKEPTSPHSSTCLHSRAAPLSAQLRATVRTRHNDFTRIWFAPPKWPGFPIKSNEPQYCGSLDAFCCDVN